MLFTMFILTLYWCFGFVCTLILLAIGYFFLGTKGIYSMWCYDHPKSKLTQKEFTAGLITFAVVYLPIFYGMHIIKFFVKLLLKKKK